MVRKHIERKLTKTTVQGYTLRMVDGAPVADALETITVWGELTQKDAERIVRKVDPTAVVGKVESVEETYKIDIDTFVANAVKIDNDKAEEA